MRWFNFGRTRIAVAFRVPGMILFSLAAFALLSVQTSVLGESQLGMTIRTAAHIPAFALVAYGWFALTHPSGAREFWLLTALMAAALLAELLEALVYNGVSLKDLVGNACGILIGYLAWKMICLPDLPKRTRVACVASIALIFMAAVFAPIAIAIQHMRDQKQWYPILFDPRMSYASEMISSHGPDQEIATEWRPDGLRVQLLSGAYPGITLTHFIPDWQGFNTLVIDVENPSTEKLLFEMHIRDKDGSAEWDDRYNFQQFLDPGARAKFRIPLAEIQTESRTREFELNQMQVIAMYSGAGLSDTFILHSVALE